MARSCLCETANIISTSFANTLAKWLEIETQPAPPELRMDFAQDGEWLECAL
ncbi:MAG: chemotaxis protein CheC [Planctomycetes bacterium]|nr:chemotaxis protein CheC [Planctomycetota bacterium]